LPGVIYSAEQFLGVERPAMTEYERKMEVWGPRAKQDKDPWWPTVVFVVLVLWLVGSCSSTNKPAGSTGTANVPTSKS